MTKKIVLWLCLTISALILYALKKMHFDNYQIGVQELTELNMVDSVRSHIPLRNFCFIAHAGGSYKGAIYLNTLEALNNSYEHMVNYIEVDINYSADSVAILSHNFVASTAMDFVRNNADGTRMTLEDLLRWMEDKEVFIITDIKTNNVSILKKVAALHPKLRTKIIPQAYTIREIGEIKRLGFNNVIYTNYVGQYPNPIIKKLAMTNCLFAITLPYDTNFKLFEFFYDFNELNTPIFTHTVNDDRTIQELEERGCKGVYTDIVLKSSR